MPIGYIKKVSEETGIPEEELDKIWFECKDEVKQMNIPQTSKRFYPIVVNKFKKRVKEKLAQEHKDRQNNFQMDEFDQHKNKRGYYESKN